ncbi:hypothetical protein [Nocardia sp. NPDC048505]|uniref:hypothetical protein n=1 Tax=unclassified Nocardia TaxID=2637762 RepID=UPI00340E1F48
MDYAPDLLNQILSLDFATLEARLGRSDIPKDFNWRGLAEISGAKAMREDFATGLKWARISILARERIRESTPDEFERRAQTASVMLLRAEMINRHASIPGDPILDGRDIFMWFLDRHRGQFETVVADASRWRELSISRIRELRYIKMELNRCRYIKKWATPDIQDELNQWISVWNILP